jgi:cold shock CspA family protein
MSELPGGVMEGRVEKYDSHAGLGWIVAGEQRYLFHCAEILDGTREIQIGAPVRFAVAHRFGNIEAAEIEKV